MTPKFEILCGDNALILPTIADNSIDAVVTDPPAGISFMGKGWDSNKGGRDLWIDWLAGVMKEVYRVLKPGGHAFVWALPRVQHNTMQALEDAGFEVRDVVSYLHDSSSDWANLIESLNDDQRQALEICMAGQVDTGFDVYSHIFGSGFPKGQNVALALEGVLGKQAQGFSFADDDGRKAELKRTVLTSKPELTTDLAKKWDGWSTGLKPAHEAWILVRKPIQKGLTIAQNVVEYGTGALNVGACSVEHDVPEKRCVRKSDGNVVTVNPSGYTEASRSENRLSTPDPNGRYPANLIHDGSDAIETVFPDTLPSKEAHRGTAINSPTFKSPEYESTVRSHNDNGGSASRYFYSAKISPTDRNEGLGGFETRDGGSLNGRANGSLGLIPKQKNTHPTVKPVDLCRYLCRLITPKGGTVLDPFAGSGSTGKGAILEGFNFIGIEQNEEYAAIARARCLHAAQQPEANSLF